MSEYAKMKNAELEALLKQRGLPHSGKKAELVARLQEDDKKQQDAAAQTTKPAKEDEIDWDDDAAGDATRPAPAQDANAAATTASESKPAAKSTATATTSVMQADAPTNEAETGEANAQETTETNEEKDFTMGLGEISIDDEIEKRKARALKFGMSENDPLAEEAMKKLERAKKFGEAGGPRGLNEALPDRKQKRRRDDHADSGRISKHRGRGGRHVGRRDGPRRPREGGDAKAGNGSWMTDADKAAAEARRARFA